jgi:hypothetical protein
VSGNIQLERYTGLFNYFIRPFAMDGNKVEIEANFKMLESGHQAVAPLKKSSNNTNQQRKLRNTWG